MGGEKYLHREYLHREYLHREYLLLIQEIVNKGILAFIGHVAG
jgi:hypothetical protein